MDADELDNSIHELEHRLERLRSLYEQYFLGIERIEPAVARKDVDRRFWTLRKIKIRNTARRFKLQTLIQRYNTYQQHWGRICREIENGTYKRQLLRAERRQGRSAGGDRDSVAPANSERAEAARAAADAAAADLESLLDGDVDLAAEAKRALDAVLNTKAPAPSAKPSEAPAPARSVSRSVAPLEKLELDDFDLGPAPQTSRQTSPPAARQAPGQPAPRQPPSPPLARPASLSPQQAPPARPALPTAAGPVAPTPLGVAAPTNRPPLAGAPLRPSAAPVARVALKQVAVPARGITELSAAPPREPARPRPEPNPRPEAAAPANKTPAPIARPVASAPAPAAIPPTAAAKPAAAAATPAAAKPAFRSAIGGSGRAADIFGPAASRPVASRPAPPAPTPTAKATAPAAAKAPSSGGGLSEDRVKQLHAKLLATKTKLNDTGAVSVTGLQRQLSASYEKLQTKHRGRQIDFDVVVKDGKAVLKPKIK